MKLTVPVHSRTRQSQMYFWQYMSTQGGDFRWWQVGTQKLRRTDYKVRQKKIGWQSVRNSKFINIKKGQSRASKLYERDYSRSYRRTDIKSGMQEHNEELTIWMRRRHLPAPSGRLVRIRAKKQDQWISAS